jgi:hypothetical protein
MKPLGSLACVFIGSVLGSGTGVVVAHLGPVPSVMAGLRPDFVITRWPRDFPVRGEVELRPATDVSTDSNQPRLSFATAPSRGLQECEVLDVFGVPAPAVDGTVSINLELATTAPPDTVWLVVVDGVVVDEAVPTGTHGQWVLRRRRHVYEANSIRAALVGRAG